MYDHKLQRGFVALMSALILAALLSAAVFAANLSAFTARFDELDGEHAREALIDARSCASVAFLSYAEDSTYTVPTAGTLIQTGPNKAVCTIDSITTHGSTTDIATHATSAQSASFLETTGVVDAHGIYSIVSERKLFNTSN
jgi:hypothetical protein